MLQFLDQSYVKWTILFGVFFLTIASIFVLNDSFNSDVLSYMKLTTPYYKSKDTTVRLLIDFGDGKKRAFEGKVLQPIAAAEALRASQENGGFSLKMTLSGDITEIGGIQVKDDKKWNWYLNGAAEERPIFDVIVGGGDKILLKYE